LIKLKDELENEAEEADQCKYSDDDDPVA